MTKRILSMLLVLIVVSSLFAFVGCRSTEELKDGKYAQKNGYEYVVVYGNNLTLYSVTGPCHHVFQITKEEDCYVGENIDMRIKLWFNNGRLIVRYDYRGGSAKRLVLYRDERITEVLAEPIQLLPPDFGAEDSIHNGYFGGIINWRFKKDDTELSLYPYKYGYLSAKIEIKRPNTNEFVWEKIVYYTGPPFCAFVLYFKYLTELPQGTSIIKITHMGGAFVRWYSEGYNYDPLSGGYNYDPKIALSLDSESVFFEVTPDGNNFFIKKI